MLINNNEVNFILYFQGKALYLVTCYLMTIKASLFYSIVAVLYSSVCGTAALFDAITSQERLHQFR